MRLILLNIFIFLSSSVLAETVTINNVRVWAAPDSTRVVFDVSGPVKHELTQLSAPHRTVIDLKETSMTKKLIQPGSEDKYLKAIRSATRNQYDLRIVFDLKKVVQYKTFQLKPNKKYGHRLVVDLYESDAEENKRSMIQKVVTDLKRARDVIVAIDAGHGGEDPGAEGPSGVYEKDVVLKISQELVDIINKEYGMRAVMIRKGDYYMSLRKRINKAREYKADLFMSVHADAFRDPKVQGSSVYVLSKRGASSEAAK